MGAGKGHHLILFPYGVFWDQELSAIFPSCSWDTLFVCLFVCLSFSGPWLMMMMTQIMHSFRPYPAPLGCCRISSKGFMLSSLLMTPLSSFDFPKESILRSDEVKWN